MAIDEDDLEEELGTDRKISVYHGSGERKECLRGKVLESRHPIYECHASCACSVDCKNRVVERGRKIPLQIFRTKDGRGWGRSSFRTNHKSDSDW
jgi:histone-lysine N-methyltransferase SUV39H